MNTKGSVFRTKSMCNVLVTGVAGSGKSTFVVREMLREISAGASVLLLKSGFSHCEEVRECQLNRLPRWRILFRFVKSSERQRRWQTMDIADPLLPSRLHSLLKIGDRTVKWLVLDESVISPLLVKSEHPLASLVQGILMRGRAFGLHVIVISQEARTTALPELLRAQCDMNIAFKWWDSDTRFLAPGHYVMRTDTPIFGGSNGS